MFNTLLLLINHIKLNNLLYSFIWQYHYALFSFPINFFHHSWRFETLHYIIVSTIQFPIYFAIVDFFAAAVFLRQIFRIDVFMQGCPIREMKFHLKLNKSLKFDFKTNKNSHILEQVLNSFLEKIIKLATSQILEIWYLKYMASYGNYT